MTRYNVFLAEDDEDDRYNFALALQDINEPISLFTAENGQDIIDLLVEFKGEPHIVILDMNMPRKNGLDSLQEIREKERFASIPIIILSTGIDERSVSDARKFGADHYIQKPSTFLKLKEVIEFCITISGTGTRNTKENRPFLIAEPYNELLSAMGQV